MNDKWTKATTDHIRMKLLLLVGGDRATNNVRSVVSISGGQGRPFNHGLRGAEPLYHHWTVSRANCGYISLSPWPAHRNDRLTCCKVPHTRTHTPPPHIVLKKKKIEENSCICLNSLVKAQTGFAKATGRKAQALNVWVSLYCKYIPSNMILMLRAWFMISVVLNCNTNRN